MVAHPHDPRRSLAPGPAAVLTVAELFERLGEDAVAVLKGGRRPTPHAAPEIPGQCPKSAAHVLGRPRAAWELVPPGDPRPGVRRAAAAAGAVLAAGAVFGAASIEDLIEPRELLTGDAVPDVPEDAVAPPGAPQERYGLPFDDVRGPGGSAAPQDGPLATGPGIAALGLGGGTAGAERGPAVGAPATDAPGFPGGGGDGAGRPVGAVPADAGADDIRQGTGSRGGAHELRAVDAAVDTGVRAPRVQVASARVAPVAVGGAVTSATDEPRQPRHRREEPDAVVPPAGREEDAPGTEPVTLRAEAPARPLDSASESLHTGGTPERTTRTLVAPPVEAEPEPEPPAAEDREVPRPAAPVDTDDRPAPLPDHVDEPEPVVERPAVAPEGARDEGGPDPAEPREEPAAPLVADGGTGGDEDRAEPDVDRDDAAPTGGTGSAPEPAAEDDAAQDDAPAEDAAVDEVPTDDAPEGSAPTGTGTDAPDTSDGGTSGSALGASAGTVASHDPATASDGDPAGDPDRDSSGTGGDASGGGTTDGDSSTGGSDTADGSDTTDSSDSSDSTATDGGSDAGSGTGDTGGSDTTDGTSDGTDAPSGSDEPSGTDASSTADNGTADNGTDTGGTDTGGTDAGGSGGGSDDGTPPDADSVASADSADGTASGDDPEPDGTVSG